MKTAGYQIDNNKIQFENGNVVEFDLPVKTAVRYQDQLIVLLETVGVIYNQNIFAVDDSGDTIWQIERSGNLDNIGDCSFSSIEVNEGNLSAYNWCGFRFTFDLKNGRIIDHYFTK